MEYTGSILKHGDMETCWFIMALLPLRKQQILNIIMKISFRKHFNDSRIGGLTVKLLRGVL
jgi:hypothetical protein